MSKDRLIVLALTEEEAGELLQRSLCNADEDTEAFRSALRKLAHCLEQGEESENRCCA
ncbi:MAG: hypothetical protein ACOCX1_05520 [Fimbriimonadaceae bacterium]